MCNKMNMRLCTVGGRRAVFHKWVEVSEVIPPSLFVDGPPGGTISDTLALVEFEDGSVSKVRPERVIFLDPAVTKFCPCKICAGGVEYDLMQKE